MSFVICSNLLYTQVKLLRRHSHGRLRSSKKERKKRNEVQRPPWILLVAGNLPRHVTLPVAVIVIRMWLVADPGVQLLGLSNPPLSLTQNTLCHALCIHLNPTDTPRRIRTTFAWRPTSDSIRLSILVIENKPQGEKKKNRILLKMRIKSGNKQ